MGVTVTQVRLGKGPALLIAASLILVGHYAQESSGVDSSSPGRPTSSPVTSEEPLVQETIASVPDLPAAAPRRVAAAPALLRAATGGDGDSWKDTTGREYRLGLVNAPETNECFGAAATAKRKALVARGFRAEVYATDAYGRSVAVVTLRDGTNLNTYLARHGYANDKYLPEFRQENPVLAAQLDLAFAAAKRESVGVWGACAAPRALVARPTKAPAPQSGCEPAYPTICLPIAGTGPDLDCPDISERRFQVLAPDPYGFDADHDGVGCETG